MTLREEVFHRVAEPLDAYAQLMIADSRTIPESLPMQRVRLKQSLQREMLKDQSFERHLPGPFRQLRVQRRPAFAIKISQRPLSSSFLRVFSMRQRMQKHMANVVVVFGKPRHPFQHHLRVAQLAQAAEKRLA